MSSKIPLEIIKRERIKSRILFTHNLMFKNPNPELEKKMDRERKALKATRQNLTKFYQETLSEKPPKKAELKLLEDRLGEIKSQRETISKVLQIQELLEKQVQIASISESSEDFAKRAKYENEFLEAASNLPPHLKLSVSKQKLKAADKGLVCEAGLLVKAIKKRKDASEKRMAI